MKQRDHKPTVKQTERATRSSRPIITVWDELHLAIDKATRSSRLVEAPALKIAKLADESQRYARRLRSTVGDGPAELERAMAGLEGTVALLSTELASQTFPVLRVSDALTEQGRDLSQAMDRLSSRFAASMAPLPDLSAVRGYDFNLGALVDRISSALREARFVGGFQYRSASGEASDEATPEGASEAPEEASEDVEESLEEKHLVDVISASALDVLRKFEFLPLRLMDEISRHPDAMRRLSPLDFERFVAALVDEVGFEEVVLTPRSGDSGRDIVAIYSAGGIRVPFIFECKRWKEAVGLATMRSLLGSVMQVEKGASIGVLVTTSRFTRGARKFILTETRIDGRDYQGLVDWLRVRRHSQ